jgi:hypothetical protein
MMMYANEIAELRKALAFLDACRKSDNAVATGAYRDALDGLEAAARDVDGSEVVVRIKITPIIANEYMDRMTDEIPERLYQTGIYDLTAREAKAVKDDAEFMADAKNGPECMRPGLRSAYRALAKKFS